MGEVAHLNRNWTVTVEQVIPDASVPTINGFPADPPESGSYLKMVVKVTFNGRQKSTVAASLDIGLAPAGFASEKSAIYCGPSAGDYIAYMARGESMTLEFCVDAPADEAAGSLVFVTDWGADNSAYWGA